MAAEKVSVGSVPAEANQQGSINVNTSAEQRAGGPMPKASGPQKDQSTGAYAPAEYEVSRSMLNAKGDLITHTSIRRDR